MDIVESYLGASAAAFANGDYREAYNGYLKSVNAVLVALSSSVKWASLQEVKGSPDGVSDLFRRAKESLSRAEEILRLSTVNDLNLTSKIAQPTTATSHGVTISNEFAEEADSIPMIPLSPLSIAMQYAIRDFTGSREQYAVASATSMSNPEGLPKLRRLLEDVRIAETRVNTLKAAMEVGYSANARAGGLGADSPQAAVMDGAVGGSPASFSSRGWIAWSAEGLAKQIAATNVRLFLRVPLGNPGTTVDSWDRSTATLTVEGAYLMGTLTPCLDFARYLERVVVGTVLTATQPTQFGGGRPASINNPTLGGGLSVAVQGPVASAARAQVIQAIVGVAHVLIHSYRDLNGGIALLRGLLDMRVSRLRRTWELVSPTCKDALRKLEEMVFGRSFHDDGVLDRGTAIDEASVEVIGLVAELLDHYYIGGGVTTIVPYLEPFLRELEELKRSYTVASDGVAMSTVGGVPGIGAGRFTVLSDIGQKAVGDILAMLMRCRGLGHSQGQQGGGHFAESPAQQSLPPKNSTPLADAWTSLSTLGASGGVGQSDAGPFPQPPWERPLATRVSDLTQIGVGDRRILHWLLSRIYRTDRELWSITFKCEERKGGEETLGYIAPAPKSLSTSMHALSVEAPASPVPDVRPDIDKEATSVRALTAQSPLSAAIKQDAGGDSSLEDELGMDSGNLDRLLSTAKDELLKARDFLSAAGIDPKPPSDSSVASKIAGLFGHPAARKEPTKPNDDSDDDWKDEDEEDDDEDGDAPVPREVLMAALTAGLAGMDADNVGPSTWSEAAFVDSSSQQQHKDKVHEDDEEDDEELLRRLESLGLVLPAVPTSPLKDLDDDDSDDNNTPGDDTVAPEEDVKPTSPPSASEEAPAELLPPSDPPALSSPKATQDIPPQRFSTATHGVDMTEDGEFVTPIETSADDVSSTHSSDPALINAALSNAVPFGGHSSAVVAPHLFSPFAPSAPDAFTREAEEDDGEDREVPRDLLVAALHAGVAGSEREMVGDLGVEEAAERVEAMFRGKEAATASVEEVEEEDVMKVLARRLEGLRSPPG
ncbi:hypothetical protein HDU67_010344 [Dinochytrium kinnereticum]|nr:hypothetical protein HDU67_010344 [Dinochytrium kinnereticum]